MKKIKSPSLRAIAKQSRPYWIAASAFGLLAMTLLFSIPTLAADEPAEKPAAEAPAANEEAEKPTEEKAGLFVYSPDTCEFTATFPSTPVITNRCEGRTGKKICYDEVSFTQVFELSSSVKFSIICNPVSEELRKTYSGEVMKATLEAMTKKTVVETFDTSFREEEHYKQAGLVGEGQVGKFSTLYIAQLWIGGASAMSVEAEMIGAATDQADKLFSDVLKSINYVPDKKLAAPVPEEKPAPEVPGNE